LDFVFIDTEHITIDREKLSWMCQAYRYAGLAPVVRIGSPDPYAACQILDGGACGLIAPYVETAAEVRELVGAVKRRPVKGAKLRAALSLQTPFEPALEAYVATQNRAHSLIVNIESVPAIEALDEILAVDGLDAVLIGPHDLSCSLGQPERYDTPEFEAAVTDIFRRARAAGIDFDHYPNWHATIADAKNRTNRIGYFENFFAFYIRNCMNWPADLVDRVIPATRKYFRFFSPLESATNTAPYCFGTFVFTKR
jgi:2-keto-3-deoxy-L-rhamnonate aldolase RhmA